MAEREFIGESGGVVKGQAEGSYENSYKPCLFIDTPE